MEDMERARSKAGSLVEPIISRLRAKAALAESLFRRRPRKIKLHGVAGGESGEDIESPSCPGNPSGPLDLRESTMEPVCAWS